MSIDPSFIQPTDQRYTNKHNTTDVSMLEPPSRKRKRSDSIASSIASSIHSTPRPSTFDFLGKPAVKDVIPTPQPLKNPAPLPATPRQAQQAPEYDSSPAIPGLGSYLSHPGLSEADTTRPDLQKPEHDNPKAQKIEALQRKLQEVRKEFAIKAEQEMTLVNDLRLLRVAQVPELVSTHPETVMTQRLKSIGEEVETERRKREDADKAIDDIRQECRTPFIVPSLLDAFIQISKMTTQALGGS
ncbi:hypothetical protein DL96DRAFT_1601776 [Flagelloscypha sp. PMI_526]|nr:hypothetical protein DL96DRAFT_1601776 [Flagelloscypha sp. PMI_526]